MNEPRKSLYGDSANYTPAASKFSDEIRRAIEPIFCRYAKEGFSERDLSHLIVREAVELECDTVLLRQTEDHKHDH